MCDIPNTWWWEKAKLCSQRKNGDQGIGSRKGWMDEAQKVLGHWKYAL